LRSSAACNALSKSVTFATRLAIDPGRVFVILCW
jgi:hypothetical protein